MLGLIGVLCKLRNMCAWSCAFAGVTNPSYIR